MQRSIQMASPSAWATSSEPQLLQTKKPGLPGFFCFRESLLSFNFKTDS
jgi:hypothetical protein